MKQGTNEKVCKHICKRGENKIVNSNTTGSTSVAGTAYQSRAPEFIPNFWWDSCCAIFNFLLSVL